MKRKYEGINVQPKQTLDAVWRLHTQHGVSAISLSKRFNFNLQQVRNYLRTRQLAEADGVSAYPASPA